MMAGGGQVGAGLALYFKTKNAKLKKYVAESIPVGASWGVGEPLMYAVTLPLVRPFVTACLVPPDLAARLQRCFTSARFPRVFPVCLAC